MNPVTYGYARVSKTDDARNLETQLHILQDYGMREEHIFTDGLTDSSMSRPAWTELIPPSPTQRQHRGRLAGPIKTELPRRSEDPARPRQAADRHHRHQGGQQHRRRQHRSEVLPAHRPGQRRAPSGRHQRASETVKDGDGTQQEFGH